MVKKWHLRKVAGRDSGVKACKWIDLVERRDSQIGNNQTGPPCKKSSGAAWESA